jgi:hypothetical protein
VLKNSLLVVLYLYKWVKFYHRVWDKFKSLLMCVIWLADCQGLLGNILVIKRFSFKLIKA